MSPPFAWLLTLTIGLSLSLCLPRGCDAQGEDQAVQQLVADYHARGRFDGVVLVARGGSVVSRAAAGLADRERGLKNDTDTPYRLCSITKQFTALLVMQQVQAGRLRLAGVVTDYLPDFRKDTGGRITLRSLLMHTSGLPQLDEALPAHGDVPGIYEQTDPKFSDAAYVTRTYLQGDLRTPPGQKFNYNNGDYLVLQAILERVTGKPYARLLQERILRPLGMTHTGVITRDTYSPRQAVGYLSRKGEVVREPYLHIANFGAAGAMYSTADDMLRWDDALDRDTLLAKPYREIMFTGDKSLGYVGLGSWVYNASIGGSARKPLLVERQGDIFGFNTLNLRAPEDGLSIIILSNVDTADLSATYTQSGLAYDILKVLYTRPAAAPGPLPQAPGKRGQADGRGGSRHWREIRHKPSCGSRAPQTNKINRISCLRICTFCGLLSRRQRSHRPEPCRSSSPCCRCA